MSTITSKKGMSSDKIIIFTICNMLFAPMIDYFFMYIPINIPSTLIIYVGLAVSIAISMYYCFKENFYSTIIVFLIAITVVCFSVSNNKILSNYVFNDCTNLNGNPFYMFFFWGLPLIPLMCCHFSINDLFNKLCKWSYVAILLASVVYIYAGLIKHYNIDHVVMPYYVELPTFICFCDAFVKKKKMSVFAFILGLAIILVSGGRGSFVTLIEFFVLYSLFANHHRPDLKTIISVIVLIIVFSVVLFMYREIIDFCEQILKSWKINSRIFESLSEDSFLDSNGRDNITVLMWKHIVDNPFGSGMWSDRLIYFEKFRRISYAHNIVVELLCHFGFFIGGALLLILSTSTAKELLRRKKDTLHILLIISVPYFLGKLMFSGSYLADSVFYFFCGILIRRRLMERTKESFRTFESIK